MSRPGNAADDAGQTMITTRLENLDCGIEVGAQLIPDRRTVSVEIRFHTGFVDEPADKLGLAHVLDEVITKGTARRGRRELSDAFDEIGVSYSSWAGRQSFGFSFTALPEFLVPALELHAEFLTTPALEPDACEIAVELSRQELSSLEDDPRELCDKYLMRQAYGPLLGRHALGERKTIDTISREDVHEFWSRHFGAGRMTVAAAGPIDFALLCETLARLFGGFGGAERAGRSVLPIEFRPARAHYDRDLEQTQVALCWPGVPATHSEYWTERVLINVLGGGMSSRLFAEVREKLGLVYFIDAWSEHPRGAGMIHVAASTTPQRCGETYRTILRELERLSEDLTDDERDRAVNGLVARTETRGDLTSSRCREIAGDLFHYGRAIPLEEKIAAVRAVTVDDIKGYLRRHPRDNLCVVTLGREPISD